MEFHDMSFMKLKLDKLEKLPLDFQAYCECGNDSCQVQALITADVIDKARSKRYTLRHKDCQQANNDMLIERIGDWSIWKAK